MELRLDSTNGPVVGTCTAGGTGGWQNWTSTTAAQ
ncbi:carbohydrate-binding protein [Micromonospora sp. SD12]